MNIGLIVLAAGESKRMGMVKQILPVAEVPMLKYVIDEVLETKCHPVTIVLGANKPKIVPVLEGIPVGIIDNANWKSGEGSSVKMGVVGTYMQTKGFDALIIVASDMPQVSAAVLNELIAFSKRNEEKELILTENTTYPVFVKSQAFEKLLDLKGDEPFKDNLGLEKTKVIYFKSKIELKDINFPEDYLSFLESKN